MSLKNCSPSKIPSLNTVNQSSRNNDTPLTPIDDSVLSPIILNTIGTEDPFTSTCRCEYYSNRNLLSKVRTLPRDAFSVYHTNIRSIQKNFDIFVHSLDELNYSFDVIGLTETWLRDEPDSLLTIPNYNIEYKNRHKTGGGVMLYIKSSFSYKLRPDIFQFSDFFEAIFIEIENQLGKNIILGLIYRPPGLNVSLFAEALDPILDRITRENKHCYLLGDFNINLLNHESHNPTNEFLNMIYSHAFRPTIDKPTRVTYNTATLIDNIFTNNLDFHTTGIMTTGISDHCPIVLFGPPLVKSNHSNAWQWKRNLTNTNVLALKHELERIDWDTIICGNDVQEDYSQFINKLKTVYENYVPYKRMKPSHRGPRNPWITPGLLKSIRTKDKLYKRYLKNPCKNNKLSYDNYRNKLTSLIRLAKSNHYTSLLDAEKSNMGNM